MTNRKQTLYFAVYINIGVKSTQKAKEELHQIINTYKQSDEDLRKSQYIEKFFWFPIKEGETRMELLFPSPVLTQEQAQLLYNKYYERFEDLTNNINL